MPSLDDSKFCNIKANYLDIYKREYRYPYEGQGTSKKYKQLSKIRSLELFLNDERLKKYKEEKNRHESALLNARQLQEKLLERDREKSINPPPMPVNKNAELERLLRKQNSEIKQLRHELRESKTTNIIKAVVTREPKDARPIKYQPPKREDFAAEVVRVCVNWFEDEHGMLPLKGELWRILAGIADRREQIIIGYSIKRKNEGVLLLEGEEWSKERHNKYFNNYFKKNGK